MPSGAFRKKKVSFSQVSNVALRDEDLSLKAKGLLALIESYLSLDNFVLYKQFLINKSKDGETSFRGAWTELKDKGYLIQYRFKNNETKQFYYEYEICDNPYVENQHVAKKTQIPCVEKPHVENPHAAFPHAGLPTQRKTTSYTKDLGNNTLYINTIHTNIDYAQVFVSSPDKELVDNIVDIMMDILVNNYESIKINNGEVQIGYLRELLLKVNMNHILYTVNIINNHHSKIFNIRSFILSVLYNAVQTLDTYYQNLVSV